MQHNHHGERSNQPDEPEKYRAGRAGDQGGARKKADVMEDVGYQADNYPYRRYQAVPKFTQITSSAGLLIFHITHLSRAYFRGGSLLLI